MTTQNKRKLAVINKENCEEHPRSNLAQNPKAPSSQEDYITQVSEEIEGRVTKRLSKEFSRTENRILGALARLDGFLMNPLLQSHSGATPEASHIPLSTNQRTNEDDSQNDLHPEAGLFHNQITQNSDPEESHDMVTGVQRESLCRRDMVTGFHEEVTYCSPRRSSGEQKERFYQSTPIPQWEYPYVDRSTPNSVGPSAVGK